MCLGLFFKSFKEVIVFWDDLNFESIVLRKLGFTVNSKAVRVELPLTPKINLLSTNLMKALLW